MNIKNLIALISLLPVCAFSGTSSPKELEKKCMTGDHTACATLKSGKKEDRNSIPGGVSIQFQGAKIVQRDGCSDTLNSYEDSYAKDLDAKGLKADRVAFADAAIPNQPDAIQKLGSQCILRVNAITRNEKELPIHAKIGPHNYDSISCVKVKSVALTEKVFGGNRQDCLFLVHCSDLATKGDVLIDWKLTRKDMKVLELPLPDLTETQKNVNKTISKADESFLKAYVLDQFCMELK